MNHIRKMSQNDISVVVDLLASMYLSHQEALPFYMPPLESKNQLEQKLKLSLDQEKLYHFVYEEQSQIVGYLGLVVEPPKYDVIFPNESSIILENIVVCPKWRKRGIAGALLDFAKKTALELGFNTIQLYVVHAFESTHQLYQKHGFKDISHFMSCDLKK